ncbi:MAG: hypothetical protein U0Y10_00050 [Spirosomataceae bacterium]
MQETYAQSEGLLFGMYVGSGVGIDLGLGAIAGPIDNTEKITAALDELCGERPFLIRGYQGYAGNSITLNSTPCKMEQFCSSTRKLDLAICYRPAVGDMEDWKMYVKSVINHYKDVLVKIQLTEEPNNPDSVSGGDGSSPMVIEAIVAGVVSAKEEIHRLGIEVQVGFNAVITFDSNDTFWPTLNQLIIPQFKESLDYVGLDFYPGVFRPLPPHLPLEKAVEAVLRQFREHNLPIVGIGSEIPIHITENGWPTSATRSESEQAEAVEVIIRTIYALRRELNVTHYEFFDLRDADSSDSGFRFGLLRDDYSAKPAFDVFKRLVAALS